MEPTATTNGGLSKSATVGMILIQALVGALIVGDQIVSRWETWDVFGRLMGISILVVLVLNPTLEMWRKRSGKEVRFSNLALSGYTLVWVTAVAFNHRLH